MPQVLVVLEGVRVDTLPFKYQQPIEVARIIGTNGMREWAAAGFPVSFSPRAGVTLQLR